MAKASNRPLSPHLQIWKWGPAMLVSILGRVSGFILASVGAMTLVWWLFALASGPESYEFFRYYVVQAASGDTWGLIVNVFFRLVGVAVTWGFFQHLFSGLRHLLLDTGAGYELNTNRFWSQMVVGLALAATLAVWVAIYAGLIGG